jgi:hypothetical protein
MDASQELQDGRCDDGRQEEGGGDPGFYEDNGMDLGWQSTSWMIYLH